MKMKKNWLLGIALLALFSPFGAVGEVRIGALAEDVGAWQEIALQARAAGLDVSLAGYPEATLYQQVYFLSLFGRAGVDVVEVPDGWLPGVVGRLLDLSPYEGVLAGEGVQLYRYGGRAIGATLPWRKDAFAAILSRSPNVGEAIELLKFIKSGEVGPVPSSAPVPLRVGNITVSKPEVDLPGVDGALEILAQAMVQAVPQGLVTALSRVPEPAREAITQVAQMFGVPLTPDGTSVELVVKATGGAVPLAAGAEEKARSPSGLSLVRVPLAQLSSFLYSMAGRAIVRPPYVPHELAASQGAGLVGAAAFHSRGITGAGVKIAVIDLGFKGLSSSQARGDLPYSVITRDFTGTGIESGYYHGTAVAEIVHDVAPDATLYLIKIGNEVDLDNAVSYCISEGVDIINHSLGWYNTNFYDGRGTICEMVQRASSAGILWVQAAGNDAQKHWEGNFSDGNSDGFLDTELTFSASAGDAILLYLTWDGWPQTSDDYDLYLYGPGGDLVASSTKTQGGTEEPTERVSTTAPQSGTYRIKVQLASGSPRRLELFSIYQDLSPSIASSSIPAPGNAAEALAVAAIDWRSYTSGPAEGYSSRGPTNDGRTKPDLAAPDNVTTGVPYYSPFPGTSAAAPHVAGIAALLLSEDPSLPLSALRARLLSQCIAMGDPNTYGAGRLEAAPQGPAALPDLVVEGVTYSPSSPSVGSTVTFQVTVRNRGGAGAGAFRVHLAGAGPATEARVSSLDPGASRVVNLNLPLSTSPETFTVTVDYYGQVAESNEDNNLRQITVTGIAPSPQGRLDTDKGSYVQGETVVITFRNAGAVTIDLPSVAPWTILDQAGRVVYAPYAAMVVTQVAPGETRSWTWDQRDNSGDQVRPGSYTVELATLNAGTLRASFTIQAPSLPDLVVEDISWTPSSPQVGQEVTFQVRVKNRGGAPAGPFYVRLSGAAGHQNAYLSGLAAGRSYTVTLRLPLSRSPETFTATVDYFGRVTESDETNNTHQVTLTAGELPLSFSLSLDRASYSVGDPVRITVRLSKSAYVYLVEVDASGKAILVFPNWWERDPRLSAGATELPRGGYSILADEPAGAEELHGFAADRPIPYFPTGFSPGFPTLSPHGAQFLSQVRSWLTANVPTGAWAEASAGFRVEVQANLPPQASFSYAPATPNVGQWISFDASSSSDPDGRIVSYAWEFGDGTTATGIRVNKRYSSAGSYTVRLTVQDDRGATDVETKTIQVGAPSPPGALPGMPEIDQPGIYVWGDSENHWHITVVGSALWSGPRAFRVVLESQGTFQNRVITPAGAPQPNVSGGRLTWEGTVGPGWVDLAFDLAGATLMKLWLYLDTDGDGVPMPKRVADAKAMVFLRHCKTNPPGNPFAVYASHGATALLPGMDFLISVVRDDGTVSPVHWRIGYWEEKAGCH
ncbi:S8 family serine peptidase [Candidatus Bipolaricaulota bacterium]|nr:S8 family serine peptidase [Candidatus Bipolaricaulota bacterium]